MSSQLPALDLYPVSFFPVSVWIRGHSFPSYFIQPEGFLSFFQKELF